MGLATVLAAALRHSSTQWLTLATLSRVFSVTPKGKHEARTNLRTPALGDHYCMCQQGRASKADCDTGAGQASGMGPRGKVAQGALLLAGLKFQGEFVRAAG